MENNRRMDSVNQESKRKMAENEAFKQMAGLAGAVPQGLNPCAISPLEDQLLNSGDYGEIMRELLHRFANYRSNDAFCHRARQVLLDKCYEKKVSR